MREPRSKKTAGTTRNDYQREHGNEAASEGLRDMAPHTAERRLILAASTGGHLAQLVRLAPRLGASDDSLWITFDSPQSRSLLAGKNVMYVPYIAPRDWLSVIRAFRLIRDYLGRRSERYQEAVSTGAALALSALFAARSRGIKTRYIESVSRTDGPSLSGRVLALSRVSRLECQHSTWSGGRWELRDSVMGEFQSNEVQTPISAPKLFVTLGTIRPYRFDAAVDAVLRTGLADDRTIWQLGCTERDDLPGTALTTVNDAEFERFILDADVVITHSGVGSILRILELGKYPVVLPRSSSRNEHVDDHQSQIARLVNTAGVAAAMPVEDLDADVIVGASSRRVFPRSQDHVR